MKTNRSAILPIFSLCLALVACVTVNVNFPESAVQKATDDYVRELYRAKEKGKAPNGSPSAKPATAFHFAFIPEALADNPTFTVNSAKALQIRERLASRLDEVLAQKRAGVLGESNDGMLVLKAPDKVKKLLAKKIEALVSSENADRKELYSEVIHSSGLKDSNLKDVAKSFARSFQAESPSGTWVQDPDGNWSQKQ